MQNFVFYTPTKMIFGKDTHTKVGEIIKEYGFKKILLHYGQNSIKASGLYDEIIKSLENSNIEYVSFGGVEPNPKISLIREGVKIAKEQKTELVLAVGGGSVMDSAKLIAAGALYNGDPWDFPARKATVKDALPVGTVLTISASGSEMSQSSVITNEELNLKRGYGTTFNRPLFSICNPCLTYSVSPYQTSCGIVDIMMHTLERYFATSEPFMITDQMAEGVLRTVIKYGKIALQSPCDYEARANLMWASTLSHNDLTGAGNSFLLICHQLEHELSGMFDCVSHGAGLSVIYPAWAKYIYKFNPKRFADLAVNVWGVDPNNKTEEETALLGIEKTEKYFKSIGMPTRLKDFDIEITDEIIEEMSEKCTFYGERTLPDYIPLGKKEIAEIFALAL
jgi:alcohol dehydrogenase YqhD (iron-dependent ADH family)